MIIGFDAKRAFNNVTGLGNYSRLVIESISKESKDNSLFLFSPKTGNIWSEASKLKNARIITPSTFLNKTFSSAWRTKGIIKDIQKHNIQVYHGLSNELPIGIEKLNIKKIVTIHDLIFLRFPTYFTFVDRRIYNQKFRSACNRANVIIAISEQTKVDIIEFYKIPASRIMVVYQDCDKSFSKRVDADKIHEVQKEFKIDKPYILCTGTIEKRKNQMTVLKAFHQANLNEHILVFTGKQTAYTHLLKEYIRMNKLKDKVLFLNQIPFEKLPALYQGAKALVYASEFEGFGLPILEGIKSRIPVLAAKNSSLTEAGGNGAQYFDVHDSLALANLMQKVINNSSFVNQILVNGDEHAARFSSQMMASELLDVYKA